MLNLSQCCLRQGPKQLQLQRPNRYIGQIRLRFHVGCGSMLVPRHGHVLRRRHHIEEKQCRDLNRQKTGLLWTQEQRQIEGQLHRHGEPEASHCGEGRILVGDRDKHGENQGRLCNTLGRVYLSAAFRGRDV